MLEECNYSLQSLQAGVKFSGVPVPISSVAHGSENNDSMVGVFWIDGGSVAWPSWADMCAG